MLYLFCVSLAVAVLMYLYNAYQGDSTAFMLAAVVIMMVFNGGDAEGAFLYGVDRTLLTAFGVIVYTLVGSLLWPVSVQDNTRALAVDVLQAHSQAFAHLRSANTAERDFLEQLLTSNEQFQTHLVSIRNAADAIKAYQREWATIANCFEQLEEVLLPALQSVALKDPEYRGHIQNYDTVISRIESMFLAIGDSWQGQQPQPLAVIEPHYNAASLRGESHLRVAAVVSRVDVLLKVQTVMLRLQRALNSLLFDSDRLTDDVEFRGQPSFIWLDRENFKTAIKVFISFWIAVTI